MKKYFVFITFIIFTILLITLSCAQPSQSGGGDDVGSSSSSSNSPPPPSPRNGYPGDFHELIDEGGLGEGFALFGFGGDLNTDQAGNRAACKHIPVILLHGNGTDVDSSSYIFEYLLYSFSFSDKFSMRPLKNFLKEYCGYNDSEIWAVSYLGQNPSSLDMDNPHCKNINDVRKFIDAVITYLNVKKVIIIGHSLGAGMARAYLFGLKKSDSYSSYGYDYTLWRFHKVAALITLSGANYGLGVNSTGEFQTGSAFENDTHYFKFLADFYDDTPFGASDDITKNLNNNKVAFTDLPVPHNDKGTFGGTTMLDPGTSSLRIFYCGITSRGDLVDAQLTNTSYLQGADLNKEKFYNTIFDPFGLEKHAKIINDSTVFNDYIKKILDDANAYYPNNSNSN